jgi:uncharacterized membrane protein YphA (DoxX/SURF4 family)
MMNAHTTSPTITATRPLTVPRLRTIVYWVATAPILLETAVGAEWDLARISYVREVFAHLGYPLFLLTILGIAKVLAVFGLVMPRFRRVKEWAYAGVFFVYAGAACSHYAVGDGPDKVVTPLAFAALTLISSALWASSQRKGNVGR